ncbi:MAG: hypothetical protein K9J42_10610, partial [Sulfuritalea sp.]|nr:hypothetical protein [Sulfuritalea sp.]
APTQSRHLVLGLILCAGSLIPMLAAFDIGPLGTDDINGPPWLGFVAAGVFFVAGLALIVGPAAPLVNSVLGILVVAGLAAIGNWIAFGLGGRACGGSISLPWLWGEGDLSGLACRIPFGFGAMIMDAVVCFVGVSTLQKALGGPPRLDRLLKLTETLVLLSLSPLLLVLVIILVWNAGIDAVKIRWKTGAWPRNEEFIARQQAKGFLKRFGLKSPPDKMK